MEQPSTASSSHEDGQKQPEREQMVSGSGAQEVQVDGGEGQPGGSKPLKRGTACLFCRKRKLKCTGTNPCPVCVKHGLECVFGSTTTKSKVKQLEEKIADLEGILTAQGGIASTITSSLHPTSNGDSRRQRDRSSSHPYPAKKPPTVSTTTQADQQIEFSLALQELFRPDPNLDDSGLNFLAPAGPSYLPYSDSLSPGPSLSQRGPALADFSSAYGHPYPQPSFAATGASDSPLWNLAGANSTPGPTHPRDSSSLDFSNLFVSPPVSSTPDNADPLTFGMPTLGFDDPLPSSLPLIPVPAWSPSNPNGSVGGEEVNTQDWGDGTVLPEGMRDHLLRLFFERRRQFCTINHVGRFYGSLDGPVESRPAPALLFAMYACVARLSPNPHISALESTFFTLARRHFEVGLTTYVDQRLIQVMQASVVLSIFCYSKSRYAEGWMQGGASIRLALMCRLHRISSKEIAYDLQCLADGLPIPKDYRSRYVVTLCPPKDGIELGERIHVFWASVFLDQLGAIAVGRSPGLASTEIETPLPRPLEEFEKGFIDPSSFRNVYALLSNPPTRSPSDPLGGILFEAVMLLASASSLDDHFIQPSLRNEHVAQSFLPGAPSTGAASASSSASPTPGPSVQESPSVAGCGQPTSLNSALGSPARPLPDEWRQTENALLRFVEHLPAQYRDPSKPQRGGIPPWHSDHGIPLDQGTYDGPSSANTKVGIQPVVFSLHVTICTAFAVLYTEAAAFDETYRAKALQAASSAVQLIQLVADIDFGQLDILLIVYWRTQARVILNEVQKLRKEGQTERAATLLVEVDVLLLAMKRMGQLWQFGIDLADEVVVEEETRGSA